MSSELIRLQQENARLKQQVILWERHVVTPMPATGDYVALWGFVEEVRRCAGRMIVITQTNPTQAQEMAGEMCQRAADLLNQAQMQEEQQAGDYDLATLPALSGDVIEGE